jgi:hypothetical protein
MPHNTASDHEDDHKNIGIKVKKRRYRERGRVVMAFGCRGERLLPMYRVPCVRLKSETGDVQ